jgi:mono/diheme cytochrome c family protein
MVSGDLKLYDRTVSSPRLALVPLALFCGVSGAVFGLAKLHLARPGLPKAPASIRLGDSYRGQTIFSQHCASCHGPNGTGGGIGPKLLGDPITLQKALGRIEAGGTTMPPALVKGQQERDVLAYLTTILGTPKP